MSDEDFKYRPNPNFDPEGPLGPENLPDFGDPTVGMARTFGKINLEFLRQEKGALNDCLRLLAIHRLPPPDWLAERMLTELPKAKQARARTLERAFKIVTEAGRLKREKNFNREQQAEALNISKTALDDMRAICKQYKEFLEDNQE